MKKITLFCLLLTVLVTLTSCGLIILNPGEGEELEAESTAQSDTQDSVFESTSNTEAESEELPDSTDSALEAAKKAVAALPNKDFDGIGIVIATTDLDTYGPQSSDNVLDAARLMRNSLVEEKYNTKIIVNNMTASTLYSEAMASVKSGMYFSDIVALPQRTLGIFESSGLLMNMNSLPYTSYSAEYYNQAAIEQMSAGYNTYAVSGALNQNPDYCYVVFFNTDMADKLGLDLYSAVEDGSWTWDMLREAAKKAQNDLDGVSGFSYNTTESLFIDTVFASSGENYITAGRGLVPQFDYVNDRTEALAALTSELLYDDGTRLATLTDEDPTVSFTSFHNGECLFFIYRLGAAGWFKNMPASYGILPLPKLDESDERYYGYLDPEATITASLVTNSNTENTGLVLQALNAASYGYTDSAYSQYMMIETLRDNSSLLMLDYIKDSALYDFANMFSVSYGKIENAARFAFRSAVKHRITLEEAYGYHREAASTEIAKNFGS